MNEQIVSIDTTVKYHFYTSGLLSATITTDTHNNILDVVYTTGFLAPSSVHDRPTTAFGLSVADNPVTNTRTTVRYTLPADAPVTIEVMDMLGNSVRVLQEGMQSAGSHTSSLDLGTLPNGAYFVRMESAGASEMQKMIVSK